MTDVALKWIDGHADAATNVGDLLAEDSLNSAVILSLFCDARASSSELPDGETHPRGWWGDQFGEANDSTGSKLWTLWREKRVPETLRRAQQYCEEALAWLKEDGVASAVQIVTSFESLAVLTGSGARPYDFALVIEVAITKPDGTKESYRFAYQWQQQALVGV